MSSHWNPVAISSSLSINNLLCYILLKDRSKGLNSSLRDSKKQGFKLSVLTAYSCNVWSTRGTPMICAGDEWNDLV